MIDGAEFWGFIVALCVLGVLYFGGEVVRDWAKETRPSFRWGDEQREAPKEADWWASHEFCLACLAIGLYVFICWIKP